MPFGVLWDEPSYWRSHMTLRIDVFEPKQIYDACSQAVTVQRLPLNSLHFPDYSWFAIDGHHVGVERKQAAEVMSEMSVMEKILRKYMETTDELALLIEGLMAPHPLGVATYRLIGGFKLGKEIVFKRSYAMIMAWLWQLDKEGITIYFTPCWEATAGALVAWYKNSLEPEHTTLRRYVKKRRALWHPNPMVETLLGIPGVKLGEKRATALIDRFTTVWGVFNASEEELREVDGIGKGIAQGLIKAIGREV